MSKCTILIGGTVLLDDFQLATDERYTNKQTRRTSITATDWHNIVVKNKLGSKFANSYLAAKEIKCICEGKLKNRQWEQAGSEAACDRSTRVQK